MSHQNAQSPASASPSDAAGAGAPAHMAASPGAQDETLFAHATTSEHEALLINLDGYEGPLDVLLELARKQKVDLREISVLELAEQYLRFVAEAKKLRLELAADYLVMAAWLAYLKSRLLLPKIEEQEDIDPDQQAEDLAFRLKRLEAMKKAAEKLLAREQLGQDFFARGEPERQRVATRIDYTATQLDLLRAYARQRTKDNFRPLHVERGPVVAIDEALSRLRTLIGAALDWAKLESFLPDEWRDEAFCRSAIASTFAATLELAKHGRVEIRQEGVFAPIYLMHRDPQSQVSDSDEGEPLREATHNKGRRGASIQRKAS
ncbi:MAG: segregation/condensation protein A [Neomegalonema sp.]|nr:segregation/condensation protein A [Neomegalonema sp.]